QFSNKKIAKNCKSLRMNSMKYVNFFLISALLACSCQKQEEEAMDLDEMVMGEEELDASNLAGEPIDTPQEVLIKEPASPQ
nr:hypothetical protein [Chlamydiota bacterium]